MSTTTLMRCGRAHPRTYDVPEGITPEGFFGWITTADGQPLRCSIEGCSRQMRAHEVLATSSTQACGQVCRDATGSTCRCSCGGRNHGKEAEA